MTLSRNKQLSVHIASARLAFHLISRKLQLLIPIPKPEFVFLYILSLPFAPAINKYPISIITTIVLRLGALLWRRYSHRDNRNDTDRAIIFVIYNVLMLETYRDGSILRNLWLIRWLSRIPSSNRSLALYLMLWLAIRSVTPAYYNFATISAVARVLADASKLCLAAFFFDAVDSIRQNRVFIVDLIRQWFYTSVICTAFHILSGCGVKLVQGHFWFDYRVLLYSTLWFLLRGTRDMWGDDRYRIYQLPNARTVTYPRYRYSPLSTTRHFRLLLLYSRHPKDPVKASLIPVLLEDAPRFEAISYTWGSSDKQFGVLIDDQEVRVTANAYNLLRDRSSYLFPCLIWIDSICINQNNISEKTEQVRLMGDIYTRASLVTVWLSTSAPRQSDMDEITDNFQATLALFQIRRFNSIEASLSNNVSQFASIASEREKPSWEAVSKLLDHPYFERSWIIQEVVLASCIRVMYRRVEIDWEIFASGLLRMGQGNIYTGVALRTADAEISPKLKRMGTLGQIEKWRRKRLRGEEMSFSDIALGIKSFQATDLRDKIFAVHGICGTVSEDLTIPDYSKKLSDVYLDATRRLIKEEGISRILFLEGVGYSLEATSGLENFPSWAPDWSRATDLVTLSYAGQKIDYCAGGDAQLDLHHLDGTSLLLSTHLFGTIEELGPVFGLRFSEVREQNAEHEPPFLQALINSYQLILNTEHKHNPYQHASVPHTVEELFWRLLIGNRTTRERPAPLHVKEMYTTYMQLAIEEQQNTGEGISQTALKDVIQQVQEAWEYAGWASRASGNHHVCVTKNGYVGLVPPLSVIGDMVAVVLGAQTPFIVRRVNGAAEMNQFQLVGECYIHGIMDGEALEGMTDATIIEVI